MAKQLKRLFLYSCSAAFILGGCATWIYLDYRTCLALFEINVQKIDERRQMLVLDDPDLTGYDFVPVNRTHDYLCDMAVTFARDHGLGESVLELYQADEWTSLKEKKKQEERRQARLRARKKPKKRKKTASAQRVRWNKRTIDPRFTLPIPRKKFWLSSLFGPRKNANGSQGFHRGIDMAAVRGVPVQAAGDGMVVVAGYQKGYGNVIVIQHDKKYKTRYAHLSKIRVAVGQKVRTGKVIGNVGSTGYVRTSGKTRDASHLHFEVEVYGKRMNPFYFLKK